MNILKINGQALEGIYVDAAISFNKPAKRVITYSVPGRNGDLVIDEGTFDNVLITYPVFEKNTFPAEFDAIVNYLASLEGYQRIECSNDPQHYRLGRFVVPQNPTAKRLNRDGYWQLSFDCKPQRWLLSGEEDTEIDANPIDEYSGDIVSIDAVALDEITELKANIVPVQSGSGDPSPTNIRPISGHTEVNIHVADGETPHIVDNIYPISLGQTVYGGTLNVTTGVLTITHAMKDMGLLDWYTTANGFYANVYGSLANNQSSISSQYAFKPTANGTTGSAIISNLSDNEYAWYSNQSRVFIRDDSFNADPAAFKTAMNGVQLCYELATPTTVQLTATEVELLLGQNNIWADTGDVEVKVTTPTVFNNPSLFNSKPLIRVYGIGTFRVNDITVTIASHDKPYIDIDCELQECYYGSENMNAYVSFSGNDFPEFQPGDNYMLLASGITKLIVTPRWWVL